MGLSLAFLQHSFLVFLGESYVKVCRTVGVHEFQVLKAEFCSAEPVRRLCHFWELKTQSLNSETFIILST